MKKCVSSLILCSILALTSACSSGNKQDQTNAKYTNKKSKITVYMPKGQYIDNKYFNNKDIVINYLPPVKGAFEQKEIDKIANSIDKNVKVLIISSKNKGLISVFDKVKKKLPGIITIAADMQESREDDSRNLRKDTNIEVAMNIDENRKARNIATLSSQMGANTFAYIYNKDSNDPEQYLDLSEAREYCNQSSIKFVEVPMSINDVKSGKIHEVTDKLVKENGKEIAVYTSEVKLTGDILKDSLKLGYIVPNINSDQDSLILAKELGLEKEMHSLKRKDFDEKVSSVLEKKNMKGRIAGLSESRLGITTEIAIETALYMYDKSFALEECYEDSSIRDRANQELGLLVEPQYSGSAYGYVRSIYLSPRIY